MGHEYEYWDVLYNDSIEYVSVWHDTEYIFTSKYGWNLVIIINIQRSTSVGFASVILTH